MFASAAERDILSGGGPTGPALVPDAVLEVHGAFKSAAEPAPRAERRLRFTLCESAPPPPRELRQPAWRARIAELYGRLRMASSQFFDGANACVGSFTDLS